MTTIVNLICSTITFSYHLIKGEDITHIDYEEFYERLKTELVVKSVQVKRLPGSTGLNVHRDPQMRKKKKKRKPMAPPQPTDTIPATTNNDSNNRERDTHQSVPQDNWIDQLTSQCQ